MNAKKQEVEAAEEAYRPSEVGFLAGLVSKAATIQEKGAAFALSIRLPMHEYCIVKVLSQRSGKSMNMMFVHLCRAGVEALYDELPAADAEAIRQEASRLHWEARKQDTGSPNYDSSTEGEAA